MTDDARGSEPDFAFDDPDDAWMDAVREAEAPRTLGHIGPFELLEEVGRGGQGVVFRARQPGTQRIIALKRLLAGSFATSSMRLRFEREVEATCALQHPNIVTVYGMETVDGLPLLAMEWIDGIPVTQWAAGNLPEVRRPPTEILELFLRICDAVQHAHSRGIVHRDLKPSNILVDAANQPHILDFGMAKRFEPESADGSVAPAADLTLSSDFVGTPSYASPEQLRAHGTPIDERSDVYSLGVLLFEILTGESPYRPWRDLAGLIGAVEHESPRKPSTLDPRLGSEVDIIVRRSLEKERVERYPSVDAMAADVRRYLAGEPILSVSVSGWTMLRRVVLRNRLAFAFMVTVFLLLAGFAVVTAVQNRKISRERDSARSILEFFREDVLLAMDPKNPFHKTMGHVIDGAAVRASERFRGEPRIEAEVLWTIGELCRGLGRYERAEELLRRSLELSVSVDPTDAGSSVKSAYSLARVLLRLRKLDEAEERLRSIVEAAACDDRVDRSMLAVSLSDLAVLMISRDRFDEAEHYAEEALEVQREIYGADHPHVGVSLINLSRIHLFQRRFDDSETDIRRAGEILRQAVEPDHPLMAQVELRLGSVLGHQGRTEEAEQHFRRGLELQTVRLGEDHPDLVNTRYEFALFLILQGRYKEGLPMLRTVVAAQRKLLGADHPHVLALQASLARHEQAASAWIEGE